jgi:hypothetical protein
MRKISLIVLFLTFCGIIKANETVNKSYEQLLDSITLVEGVPYYSFIGKNGERSPYQITINVWYQYCRLPFATASKMDSESKRITRLVAIQHLKWISQQIDYPNAYNMALSWNAGISAMRKNRTTKAQRSYAQRVQNILTEKIKIASK